MLEMSIITGCDAMNCREVGGEVEEEGKGKSRRQEEGTEGGGG